VNGSTAGILTAICSVVHKDTPFFISSGAHKSVYNACTLVGVHPQALPTHFNVHEKMHLKRSTNQAHATPPTSQNAPHAGIKKNTLSDLDKISLCTAQSILTPTAACPDFFNVFFGANLKMQSDRHHAELPENAVVLIVSPTYEGFVSDIASIADIVHAKNGILIVDEAHGAHFPFHDAFPQSAITLGADIVINSFHKTLPMLTPSAALHIRGAKVDVDKIMHYLQIFQTSSPSYMLMACCDHVLNLLTKDKNYFDVYIARLMHFREHMVKLNDASASHKHVVSLISDEIIGTNGIFALDLGKLLFDIKDANIYADAFRSRFKVECELTTDQHVLAMTSVADTDDGFHRLHQAILSVASS